MKTKTGSNLTTAGRLRAVLDGGKLRRFFCWVLQRHRWPGTLRQQGRITPKGYRPARLFVCRYCGKAWGKWVHVFILAALVAGGACSCEVTAYKNNEQTGCECPTTKEAQP